MSFFCIKRIERMNFGYDLEEIPSKIDHIHLASLVASCWHDCCHILPTLPEDLRTHSQWSLHLAFCHPTNTLPSPHALEMHVYRHLQQIILEKCGPLLIKRAQAVTKFIIIFIIILIQSNYLIWQQQFDKNGD